MDFSDAIGRKFEIFASLTEAQALDASFVSEHPAAMCFCKDTHSIVFGGVVVSPDSAEAKLKTIYQADMLAVMDGLTNIGEWMAKAQAVQGSYLVMYDSTKSCGVVEMFMDAMGHGLTQVYTTTGTLTDGVFDSGHEDGVVRKYVRHFGVMSSGNYDPGVWTDWELVWSSEDKATYEDVTKTLIDHERRVASLEKSAVKDLGTFDTANDGYAAAADRSITEDLNVSLITFRTAHRNFAIRQMVDVYSSICTQYVFFENAEAESLVRRIVLGGNYDVQEWRQLKGVMEQFTLENGKLIGHTPAWNGTGTDENAAELVDLQPLTKTVDDKVATLETQAMRTIIEVAGVDYITTAAPTNSTMATGLPLYWLARPAAFAVKSGTTYYTMPSTDERFAACGLRRVGQLFKCGGETFYLDADLNPVFVNSSVRFDRSGTSVKVYPSNSTLRSLYEAAGAVWNEDTGYYELNNIKDIDDEEMSKIYTVSPRFMGNNSHSHITNVRTFISCAHAVNIDCYYMCGNSLGLVCFHGLPCPKEITHAFTNCKLLRIVEQWDLTYKSSNTDSNVYINAKELVQHEIRNLKKDFASILNAPRFSYYSLQYLATNAKNTAAITVTLPTPQATIINTILGADAGEVADLLPEEQNFIFQQLAQMPWEAKLKVAYTQPIWREDNGSTIAFTNRMPQLDEAGETYTFQDVAYNDVRPSLIKHEKGANGEYIYAAWYDYVNKMLATDRNKVGSELVQYTTALNTNFAVSIYDWIDLANKFGAKGITIANGGAAAASATEE